MFPLRNPATNADIPDFPATPRAIDELQTPAMNALLDALGIGTGGQLASKKQRVRITVGLPAVRIQRP